MPREYLSLIENLPVEFLFLVPFGIPVALMILALAFRMWRAHKRRAAFRRLAKRLGLRYRRGRDRRLVKRHDHLNRLRAGDKRYAFNILEGMCQGHNVSIFDYHFQTSSLDDGGRRTKHHYVTILILYLDGEFPRLDIYPETMSSRIWQMLARDDIDFESIAFSNAFTVRSRDKKFAYDICHARMMAHLLEHPYLSLEIEKNCFATGGDRQFKPDEVVLRIDTMVELRELFPRYLFETPPVSSVGAEMPS